MNWGPGLHTEVRVSELRKAFAGVEILGGVTFDVAAGASAVILGPNGSGKSTILRILAGVVSSDSGSVLIGEAPVGRGLASFVPAGDRMLDWRLTGAQNLAFFARACNGSSADWRDRIEETTTRLGATDLMSKQAGACSTGQRRRLMLCAAFSSRAPLLLLDEPFEDLDEAGRGELQSACAAWADGGGTVIFAAPDPAGAPACENVMRLGRLGPRSG
jgi:ABC-type multidrug transport system ATPase subunit